MEAVTRPRKGNVAAPKHQVREVDPKRDMMLFDMLPAAVQDVVREAPTRLDMEQIYGLVRYEEKKIKQGRTSVDPANRVLECIQRAFPEWTYRSIRCPSR